MLPSDRQIEELHRKYARSEADFELIYTHCQIVEAIAMQLLDAKPQEADRQLVHVGCLLHDIGVYSLIDDAGRITQGVTHGVVGEQLLKDEGFPEVLWRFASHHTGVGLTAQDVTEQGMPIPPADYTARTLEEQLIMYADKFHSKNRPPTEPPHFCSFEWFRQSIQQFGADKAPKFDHLADLFGKPDLVALSQRFGHAIRDIEPKGYKAVLLDWDGNLARTLDVWLGALKTASLAHGHEFTNKEIGANFTVFQERMTQRGIQNVEAIVAQADEIATRECPEVELYPDALWTLQELRAAGKKVALVTTSRHDQIDPLLTRHGLDGLFDAVVCGDDVVHHKPHPEPLEKAMTLLGARPEEAIMVGDSASDIGAAHNAGVDSVLFFPRAHSDFYELEELQKLHPTHIIDDFRKLVTVVSRV